MPITVVVADDEPFIPVMVKTMLDRDGRFQVETVSNGIDALRACRAAPPDVLLLDVMMPGIDGFKVCRLLKSDEATSGTHIIMLTALTQKVDLTEGYESGADEYITKPFTPKRLVEAIDKVLDLRSEQPDRTTGPRFRRGDRVVHRDGRLATVRSRVPPSQWPGDDWGYVLEFDDGATDTAEANALRSA